MTADIKALRAVYMRGLIILRDRLGKVVLTIFLTPALYALAFGWGVGRELNVEGVGYLSFMLPGLIAMSGMNQSFSIAPEMNISRFFNCFFEEYLLSPASDRAVVLGNVLYGITKGLASFGAVLIIGLAFGCRPAGGTAILIPVLLNSFMFASLAVWISLTVKNHRDLNTFQTFVIVPMSFISGTFFSIDALPPVFRWAAQIIPLTHASVAIRAAYLGRETETYHIYLLIAWSVFFFIMAVRSVRKSVI